MKRVTVTALKNQLSKYLRLVKQGETLEVVEHAVPIAYVRGVGDASDRALGLQRLVREGLVTQARDRDAGPKTLAEPAVPCSGDVVRALVEGRGDR
jgi:prevent-host-death family protein